MHVNKAGIKGRNCEEIRHMSSDKPVVFHCIINPLNNEAQTALFKDPVRTAQ